eukprot:scaffold103_cov193-Alexandrium_tamarense.AAC.21
MESRESPPDGQPPNKRQTNDPADDGQKGAPYKYRSTIHSNNKQTTPLSLSAVHHHRRVAIASSCLFLKARHF